jgi:DNA repair protein RadD
MASSFLLKRLTPAELAWFRVRGAPKAMARGPRIDGTVVDAIFGHQRSDEIELRCRWYDGRRVVEDLRTFERHGGSWWLAGRPLNGDRLRRAKPGDIVVIRVERIRDAVGWRWLLTLDVILANERQDEEVAATLKELIGSATSAHLEGAEAARAQVLARQQLPAFGGGRAWEVDSLTDREWVALRTWLTQHLRLTELRQLLELHAGEEVTALLELLGREAAAPRRRDLAEAVIRRYGVDLLADGWRRELLADARSRRSRKRAPKVDLWVRGSPAARRYAEDLGLPAVMAGHPVPPTADFEDIAAFPPLGGLHPYQLQLAQGIRETLHARDWRDRRAVVWLPTGTGKTRVCVETLLMECFLAAPRNCLLWIADREELCEQAIETFRHVWMVKGFDTPSARGVPSAALRVVRLWGSRHWQEPPAFPTLVVASIQTLARRLERPGFAIQLAGLGDRCAAVVFDEAHHVVAPTYRRVLTALGLGHRKNALGRAERTGAPLIGLTATPGRSRDDETERLVRRFHGRLLEPDEPFRSMGGFVDNGFLARPRLEVVRTGYQLQAYTDEGDEWERYKRLPRNTLRRAGRDRARTAAIIADLERRLEDLHSVLVFACSVEHAETLAEVLSQRGHRAVALHGGSPRALRHSAIRRFRERSIQVLVTCDLLATGFDAPNVDCVVLARPVESRVLFAQMIGRGLRGPKNGGTAECLLLDYEDSAGAFRDLERLRADFRSAFLREETAAAAR